MKTITKIITKSILLGALVFFLFGLLTFIDRVFIGNQYSNTYNASLVDKYERLQTLRSPKLVLIGNSNLAFGIDSKLLEDELGIPVVNMGYLGSLGNEFHEEMIKGNIGKGDIVVVAHTTYSDDDSIGYIPAVWITMDCNTELYHLLRFKDWLYALPGYPNYLRNAFLLKVSGRGNADTKDSYSRNAFNEYGDVVVRTKNSQMNPDLFFKTNEETLPEINDKCINRLNVLNEYIESCGATMVVAAYPIAYGRYSEFDKADVDLFQELLSERLDCEIISTFSDYMYKYDFFYDQVYHLNEQGVDLRTIQLMDDIKKWIENGK